MLIDSVIVTDITRNYLHKTEQLLQSLYRKLTLTIIITIVSIEHQSGQLQSKLNLQKPFGNSSGSGPVRSGEVCYQCWLSGAVKP